MCRAMRPLLADLLALFFRGNVFFLVRRHIMEAAFLLDFQWLPSFHILYRMMYFSVFNDAKMLREYSSCGLFSLGHGAVPKVYAYRAILDSNSIIF